MALVIYIDVLLVVNLYINYFLVRGTSLMLRRKVSPRRVILASAVGAVGSLLILVPDLNPILCVLIKSNFFKVLIYNKFLNRYFR